jgi:hypothetical protein
VVGVFSAQLLDGAVCLYRAHLLRSPEFDRQQRAARVRYAAMQKSCFFRSLSYACGDLRWPSCASAGWGKGRTGEGGPNSFSVCVLGDAGDFAVLCVCVCVCVCVCHSVFSLSLLDTPFVCADARLLHFAFAVCAGQISRLDSSRRLRFVKNECVQPHVRMLECFVLL